MHGKFEIKEVQEFDIYQEEQICSADLDQRLLAYLKKVVDIFEYVNNIQMLQFAETWKAEGALSTEKNRICSIPYQDLNDFQKTLSIKNMSAFFILDEKYLVSVRQTIISK